MARAVPRTTDLVQRLQTARRDLQLEAAIARLDSITSSSSMTTSYRIYSEGTSAKPLYEAICKVEYDLDLSHLVAGERP